MCVYVNVSLFVCFIDITYSRESCAVCTAIITERRVDLT